MVTDSESLLNPFKMETSEEEKFQSLMNSVNGFEEFTLDSKGIIISSNLEAVTITGYEEWEVIGKHISLFYSQKEIIEGKAEEDLAKACINGKHITNGFRVKKKGALFFAKMKFVVLSKGDDKVTGYRVILFDSTHRAMYAVSTRRMKEEYLSLFNNSFIGIFKFRLKDYAFTMLNDKALQIIQREKGHLKINELFLHESEFENFIDSVRTSKSLENFEFRLNVKKQQKYCSISCKLFSYRGFVEGILSDITDKKSHINQIQKLNTELDNFLYHASHDIRAPLPSILGLINLIKTDNQRENTIQYAEKISDRVRHMDSLLKDLSHVAFNNSQPVQLSLINPFQLLEEITKPFKAECPFVKCITDIQVKCRFFSDAARLNIILHNIISNAFKYQRHNSTVPMVRIKFESTADCAIIQVEDNGCGIEQPYLQDIFKLFFKMNCRGKGSGLGLYVAQIMLQKLDGKIDVISKVNVGSCFTFSIPNKSIQSHQE
jgi:PAS domain S-box-containing protein